jgi:hypothetical protein
MRSARCVYPPFADFNYAGSSLFALFYGLDWVATVPPTVAITLKQSGREKANLVFGWVFAAHQLGAATAALGAGRFRTELATYLPAFLIAGSLCVLRRRVDLAARHAVAPDSLMPQNSPSKNQIRLFRSS